MQLVHVCIGRWSRIRCPEQNLHTLLELLHITVVPSLRKENNFAWKFLLCSSRSGNTNIPGLLQALQHIRFLRKSAVVRIHHLNCNWNSQASGHYVSLLQLSFTISVLSIAYNVLYVRVRCHVTTAALLFAPFSSSTLPAMPMLQAPPYWIG